MWSYRLDTDAHKHTAKSIVRTLWELIRIHRTKGLIRCTVGVSLDCRGILATHLQRKGDEQSAKSTAMARTYQASSKASVHGSAVQDDGIFNIVSTVRHDRQGGVLSAGQVIEVDQICGRWDEEGQTKDKWQTLSITERVPLQRAHRLNVLQALNKQNITR